MTTAPITPAAPTAPAEALFLARAAGAAPPEGAVTAVAPAPVGRTYPPSVQLDVPHREAPQFRGYAATAAAQARAPSDLAAGAEAPSASEEESPAPQEVKVDPLPVPAKPADLVHDQLARNAAQRNPNPRTQAHLVDLAV